MSGFGKRFWGVTLCLGFLAFANGLRADVIEHTGPILSDTVWRSADEHLIVGDVTVYPQVTLTIEAGATVRVAAKSDSTASGSDTQRSELIVNGSLLVQGTVDQPVILTSNATTPKANDWGGIRFNSRFPFVLRHAVVEYGSVGVDYRVSGAVSASVAIEDSTIRYSGGNGVYLQASSGATLAATVRNNTVYSHSGSGIALANGSSNSTLAATVTGNLVYSTTGVSLSNSGTLSGTRLADNEIRNNSGNGLYVYNYTQSSTATTVRLEGNPVRFHILA